MSEAYPRPDVPTDAPPPTRNPIGWVVLGFLFAFMAFNALNRPTSSDPKARVERYTSALETALQTYEAGDNPIAQALSGESADGGLRRLEREVEPRHRQEAVEAGFWGVVRRELGEGVTDADLAPLARDRDYAILAEGVRSVRRAPEEARSLAAKLDQRGAASKLAADQVRRAAGLPIPAHRSTTRQGIALLFGLTLLLGSGLAWLALLGLGLSGMLTPLGPATQARTGPEADRLALRAATLMAAFLVLSLVGSFLVRAGLDARAAQALAFGGMLVAVPWILRRDPQLAEVGLSTRDLARNVGLGLWAFLLELPVTGGIAIVCVLLLRNLPQPEHPAATALTSSPDLLTILVTFFSGAIVAPFWEETMFRGLLFPALRQVLRGPIPAALLSSFFFASIHPQGPVLWAALASVALFSCVLAQTTRSLVPSITMHLAHNATLLTIAVLVGR